VVVVRVEEPEDAGPTAADEPEPEAALRLDGAVVGVQGEGADKARGVCAAGGPGDNV